MTKEQIIRVPSQIVADDIGLFLNNLEIDQTASICTFDFTRCRWCEPFALLRLADGLKTAMTTTSQLTYRAKTTSNDFFGYACHLGFFRFVNFDVGNNVGEARGSNTYIPIESWKIGDLIEEAGYNPVAALIENKAAELATIMLQQDCGTTFEYIRYSIREIMRNCVEHSEGQNITFCAQFWPKKQEVEIGILDDGVGLLRSLRRNQQLTLNNDEDALQMAILPSVSGSAWASDPRDEWANSGYGLYMTSCLCGHNGQFRIISGSSGLTLVGNDKLKTTQKHAGTAVQLRLNLENVEMLSKRLRQYSVHGEQRAREIKLSDRFEASSASTMVSLEFPDR